MPDDVPQGSMRVAFTDEDGMVHLGVLCLPHYHHFMESIRHARPMFGGRFCDSPDHDEEET